MKTIYLLIHIWSDFEVHNDTVGVYETKELAEKALEKFAAADFSFMYEDSEVIIEEVPMNHFTWEKDEVCSWEE